MGWGRYLLLGDLGQQLDLSDQKSEIEQLRNEFRLNRKSAKDPSGEIAQLHAEIDELRLYLTAVIRLLLSKGSITQEDIKQFVDQIDTEDGSQDGGYSGPMK